MHEKDLRRIALESGKTTSRKAKARALSTRSSAANSPVVSPQHSPGGSRTASRNPSRHGSDDDEFDDDDLNDSVASLDINDFNSYESAPVDVWQHDLRDAAERIIESNHGKGSNSSGRQTTFSIYTNILRAHYVDGEIENQLDELIPALLKGIKAGAAELECIFALKALSMTALTTGDELFHEVYEPIRTRIQDGSLHAAQATAIHTLGAAAFFGGADIQDTEEVMDFLLDIAESDGDSISAHDNGAIVKAALQEWGFLATQFENFEDRCDRPLEIFDNQLESTDLGVQTAAMENIALIYENSVRKLEDGEDADPASSLDEQADEYEYRPFKRDLWVKRYTVFHDNSSEYSLKSRLSDLARSSARYLAKDKRKDLHAIARDVLHTIENPYRGPRYSTALDEDGYRYLGHRYTVRFSKSKHDGSEYVIDRWWKLMRYEAIKRTVAGGFAEHFGKNEVVRTTLPRVLDASTEF